MSADIRLSTVAANAAANAVAKLLDGGYACIYEGPRPDTTDTPPGRGTKLLAKLQFASPAFKAAENGEALAYPMQADKDAKDTGRPMWFRTYQADGTSGGYDGDITHGPGGAMQMRALVIGKHSEVYIDRCVIRMPKRADGVRP